jgi:threonine aldolase
MDGARLANALARERLAGGGDLAGATCSPSAHQGGGALAAEAVLFSIRRGAGMSERRKRGGHLVSKHRFIAAQMEAYLADDLWSSSLAAPTPWPIGSATDSRARGLRRSGRSRETRCS